MKLKKLSTMPVRSGYCDGNLLVDLNTGWCGNRNAIYFDPNRTVPHLWKESSDAISARQQESAVGTILQKYPPVSTEPLTPIGWIKTTVGMDAVVLQSANGIVRMVQADYWHDAHAVGFDRITINPNLPAYIESHRDTEKAGCIVFWSGDTPVVILMPIAVYNDKEAKKLRAITPLSDKVMESAFATLADQLEAQDVELLQEVMDLWDVYEYIKGGGKLKIWRNPIGTTVQFYREGGTVTTTMLHVAAERVRQQEGE